jgi:hypothetical protein
MYQNRIWRKQKISVNLSRKKISIFRGKCTYFCNTPLLAKITKRIFVSRKSVSVNKPESSTPTVPIQHNQISSRYINSLKMWIILNIKCVAPYNAHIFYILYSINVSRTWETCLIKQPWFTNISIPELGIDFGVNTPPSLPICPIFRGDISSPGIQIVFRDQMVFQRHSTERKCRGCWR